MADAAQRVLMNEFKALSKETWTNIEVRYLVLCDRPKSGGHYRAVTDQLPADERQCLRMERSTHCAEP